MHSRYILKSITFKNIFQLYTCNYYPHINHCFDIFYNPFAMFIPWIKATIHAESVRLFACILLTNWLVKSRVQDNKYRKIKKEEETKISLPTPSIFGSCNNKVLIFDFRNTAPVRGTINLFTWVNAESAYLVLGIRYWMLECWHLTNRV